MKLYELKVELARQILESNDEQELRVVDSVLNPQPFKLTAAHKVELDRAWARFKSGKGSSYTWDEVLTHVRGKRRK